MYPYKMKVRGFAASGERRRRRSKNSSNLQSPPNTKLAKKVGIASLMKCHQKLTIRQPELTSLSRVSGINKVVVHMIFDVSKNIADENKITDSRIFNMDETSHTVLQRPEKIIAQRDKHQVRSHLIV
jgi:hypothetical protein